MTGKFRLKSLLAVCLVVLLSWGLAASGNIVVQLRFYQGFNQKGDTAAVISGSYYLKKVSEGKVIPYMEGAKEAQKLKSVYKLKEVKQIGSLEIVLKGGGKNLYRTGIRINGRDLVLDLETKGGETDRFSIKISEKGSDKKPLLDSEIIVPKGKTAVLGFKDSSEKIYFMAFNRKNGSKKQTLAEKLGAKSIIKPKLLKIEEPEYPAEAAKAGVEGEVVIQGQTDLEGRIHDVTLLHGHPLLAKAVKESLKKWHYSVWEVDGVKKPLRFSLIFIFRLIEDKNLDWEAVVDRHRPKLKKDSDKKQVPRIMELITISSSKAPKPQKKEQTLAEELGAESVDKPKLVRRKEPEYPKAALKASIEGAVIVTGVTDSDGNMKDVTPLVGHPMLRETTIDAVKQWTYIPWKVDGKPKPVVVHLVFIYHIEKGQPVNTGKMVKETLNRYKDLFDKQKKKHGKVPVLMEVVLITGKK